MRAYYGERKRYMVRIYACIMLSKVGHIYNVVARLTYNFYKRDTFLLKTYPLTDEGDQDLEQACILAIIQHLFGASLIIAGIILLNLNLDLARRVNPIIITLSFVLDLPIIPVYDSWYLYWAFGSHFAQSYLVPWVICETFGGQLLSWSLIFGSMVIAIHRSAEMPYTKSSPTVVGGYIVVSFAANFFLSKDIMFAYRRSVSQKIQIRHQRDEFHQILSSIPQGVMLTGIKDRKEIRQEIEQLEKLTGIDHMSAIQKILPIKPQFVNK